MNVLRWLFVPVRMVGCRSMNFTLLEVRSLSLPPSVRPGHSGCDPNCTCVLDLTDSLRVPVVVLIVSVP